MNRVIHYPFKPCGLDDFQTMWLHEFLILMFCKSNIWSNLDIIDYVASPIKQH